MPTFSQPTDPMFSKMYTPGGSSMSQKPRSVGRPTDLASPKHSLAPSGRTVPARAKEQPGGGRRDSTSSLTTKSRELSRPASQPRSGAPTDPFIPQPPRTVGPTGKPIDPTRQHPVGKPRTKSIDPTTGATRVEVSRRTKTREGTQGVGQRTPGMKVQDPTLSHTQSTVGTTPHPTKFPETKFTVPRGQIKPRDGVRPVGGRPSSKGSDPVHSGLGSVSISINA
jgi:hypothetical protein